MKVAKKSNNFLRIGLAIFLITTLGCFSGFLFLSGSFLEPFRVHFQSIAADTKINDHFIFKVNPDATAKCQQEKCASGWSAKFYTIQAIQTGVTIYQTNMSYFATVNVQGKEFLITADYGGGSEQFMMFSIHELDNQNDGIRLLQDFTNFHSAFSSEIGACENPFFVNNKLIFKHYNPKCSDIGNFWFQGANIYELDLSKTNYQLLDRGEKSFYLPW